MCGRFELDEPLQFVAHEETLVGLPAMELVTCERVVRYEPAGDSLHDYVFERYHVYPYRIDAAFGAIGEPAVEFDDKIAVDACNGHIIHAVTVENVVLQMFAHILIFI